MEKKLKGTCKKENYVNSLPECDNTNKLRL